MIRITSLIILLSFFCIASAKKYSEEHGVQLSTSKSAINYESTFFEDGKYWLCGRDEEAYSKISVVGDTIINGVTARKLQSEILETGEKSKDFKIGYEHDGKVYFWINGAFRLFFDFNSPQTQLQVYNYFGEAIEGRKVDVGNPIIYEIEGIYRRCYGNCYYVYNCMALCVLHWIEGIGTEDYNVLLTQNRNTDETYPETQSDPFWRATYIYECYRYDKCLYRSSKLIDYMDNRVTEPEYSSLTEINNDEQEEAVYDLMGRRVDNPKPGNIYITRSGKRLYR